MTDGGYDDGYASSSCFWGTEAASLVKEFLASRDVSGLQVLDIGCGEGKNANAFAQAGASVIAIDCSELALENGKRSFKSPLIEWRLNDVMAAEWAADSFDVIVSYGLFHCLANADTAGRLITRLQNATKCGGFNIFCVFNDRSHDLSAHPGFNPLLLNHKWYLDFYSAWKVENVSDSDLRETHPHNLIPHHHSLTRVIAKKHA